MATRVSARINDDGSDDDGYDHPQAREYSGLVRKNTRKVIKEAEDNVWKKKIDKEKKKIAGLCTKVNKRTGRRCCTDDVYHDPKGKNNQGYCQRHFYIHNREMKKAKKQQNASHPLDPPPATPSIDTFFSSTTTTTNTTTSPDVEEQLLQRVRNANPNFQLRDSELPNTTASTSQANNNNNSSTTTTAEDERKRKFQEEEAKREKEEEERMLAEFRAAAEKRARIMKRLKEQAEKEVEEKLRKEADGDARMPDAREEDALSETSVTSEDEPKDKNGRGPSGTVTGLSEEDERFLEEQTRGVSNMDLTKE